MRVRADRVVPIAKSDSEQRLVYGVVLEPDVEDAQGDVITADEIERAAHRFMHKYATRRADLGTDHTRDVGRDRLAIVESMVAPIDFTLGSQRVRKGSWVLTAKVLDPALWAGVKQGVYTGWSIEGWGDRDPAL